MVPALKRVPMTNIGVNTKALVIRVTECRILTYTKATVSPRQGCLQSNKIGGNAHQHAA